MTTSQINCFLAAASTLNFTKAAKMLFITQPALSKQIASLEKEFNMQLFVRLRSSVRLTPAGMLLAKRLPEVQKRFEDVLEEARVVHAGHSGALTIGILESQMVPRRFTDAFGAFCGKYPNISVKLMQASFSRLRELLDTERIDMAVTLELDIGGGDSVDFVVIEESRAGFVISRNHPIGNKADISISELSDTTLISISPEDCPRGAAMLQEDCRRQGISSPIRYAPSLSTAMLWIDAGVGYGIINGESPIAYNENIRIIESVPLGNANICLAWSKRNGNPARALFLEAMS